MFCAVLLGRASHCSAIPASSSASSSILFDELLHVFTRFLVRFSDIQMLQRRKSEDMKDASEGFHQHTRPCYHTSHSNFRNSDDLKLLMSGEYIHGYTVTAIHFQMMIGYVLFRFQIFIQPDIIIDDQTQEQIEDRVVLQVMGDKFFVLMLNKFREFGVSELVWHTWKCNGS